MNHVICSNTPDEFFETIFDATKITPEYNPFDTTEESHVAYASFP